MTNNNKSNINNSNNIKKYLQKGGTDGMVNTSTSNEVMPNPINRLPYDVKIFSFLCVMGILVKIIFGNASHGNYPGAPRERVRYDGHHHRSQRFVFLPNHQRRNVDG